jgi:hypothetical protein
MSDNFDIKEFIRNRLDNLDNSNKKYNHLIINENIKIEERDNNIWFINFFNEDKKVLYENKCSVLGTLDLNTNIWLWGWVTPNFTIEETKDSREILNYGLLLEPNSNSNIHFYIKSHFVNSRIYFDSDTTFDIHLALSFYITKKAKFIYPRRIKGLEGTNLIVYYLVY